MLRFHVLELSPLSRYRSAIAVVLFLAALAAGSFLLRSKESVAVDIPQGLSAVETAHLLKDKGVISSTLLFRAIAKITGSERRLQPGSYVLRRRMPIWRAVYVLAHGLSSGVKITIPEGFTARQIAERLEAAGLCKAADFSKYVHHEKLEGFLFPTTYFFNPSWGVEKIARRMRQEFDHRAAPIYALARPKPTMSLAQVLTLASIIEREAGTSAEKPMIAAVYINRLRRRMKLQSVPTVQYALGYWKTRFDASDVTTASPYNTYLHFGLPPGPICSPGLDSIAAVLAPARTEALYMNADGKGANVFSVTNEEHAQARRRYERQLRAAKKAKLQKQ